MQVTGLGSPEAQALEKARFEPGQLGYAVPIDLLEGATTVRHLVRFSQKGAFTLPPARYTRMYAPDEQALEDAPPLRHFTVE